MKSFLVFLSLSIPLLHTHAQTCDRAVKWKDATYLKRSTGSGSVVSIAEWRRFRDADWLQLDFDGQSTTTIRFANGISLVLAKDSVKPMQLAEIATAIESPMWSGGQNTLLNMATPCQLKEGENTPINQRNLNLSSSHGNALPKLYGNMRRQGMRVTYAIEVQRGKTDEQLDALYGTWEYEANLRNFPADYDVQGWSVYRGDLLQAKLPVGKRLPIAEVLQQN